MYGQQTGNGTGYNGDKGIIQFPLSFLRAGYYHYTNGARINRGQYGNYRESRAYSGVSAYYLYFYATSLRLQNSDSKGNGFSVRCVSK